MTSAQVLDLSIVIAYLVCITVYGIFVGRRGSTTQDGYFLGGRQFTWFAIGSSVFATNISITQFMSGGGLAHSIGLAAINNDLVGGMLLAVSAVLFVPVYIRSRIFTIPEFLERRYNRGARLVFSWTYLIQSVLAMPTGFYIGGLAILGLFGLGNEHLAWACVVIGVTVGLYSVLGGLTSVVKTDVIQVFLLIAGGLAVSLIGVSKAGGWGALQSEFMETHFELLLPRGTQMPWTALPGIALHSCYFAFCSIHIIQRVLAAKNEYHAKTGMLFSAWLKFLAIPLFAVPGIVAVKLYPDALGDATYAMLVRDLLPAGISGLVMAGMIAALMSSADSGVNAMASVVAVDLYPSFSKNVTEKKGLRLGKITAALIMVWGVVLAPHYQKLGPIYPFILKLGGFLLMPIGVCFIFGRFSRRVNHQGAIACLVFGVALGLAYVLTTGIPAFASRLPGWMTALHFYELLPVFFVLLAAILFGVSWMFPAPGAARLAVLDAKDPSGVSGAEGRPAWQSFQLWFAAFLAVLGLMYVVY